MLLGQKDLDRGINPVVMCWGPRVERAWRQIVQPIKERRTTQDSEDGDFYSEFCSVLFVNLNGSFKHSSLQLLKPKLKVCCTAFSLGVWQTMKFNLTSNWLITFIYFFYFYILKF